MVLIALGLLGCLSLAFTLWQWQVARRFPLHRRTTGAGLARGITVLKPLKGADIELEASLESWLEQEYDGPVQVLFGVASADDPAVSIVRELLARHRACDAGLVVCGETGGSNAKVAKLAQLQRRARHEWIVVSDADVRAPRDLLENLAAGLGDPEVGLVHCPYRLANPVTRAMEWEAVAINSDFWSSVLQARSLGMTDFALGAVMAFRREALEAIGGWASLADHLADDYELGRRIGELGGRIDLSPVVVSCWESPRGWREVWQHQLRWARTIRVCRPGSYFFSVLSNGTLWPVLWLVAALSELWRVTATEMATETGLGWLEAGSLWMAPMCWVTRILTARSLQRQLHADGAYLTSSWWMVAVKDLLQVAIWVGAFTGNRVEWRRQRYQVSAGGRLTRLPN